MKKIILMTIEKIDWYLLFLGIVWIIFAKTESQQWAGSVLIVVSLRTKHSQV